MQSRACLAIVCAGPRLCRTLKWMKSESLWAAGYREPAAPCPLRLPSPLGDRASIQRGELVGWRDDLRLKSMAPSPLSPCVCVCVSVKVCVCVCTSEESPFKDSGCNQYWSSLIGKDAKLTGNYGQTETKEMRMVMWIKSSFLNKKIHWKTNQWQKKKKSNTSVYKLFNSLRMFWFSACN